MIRKCPVDGTKLTARQIYCSPKCRKSVSRQSVTSHTSTDTESVTSVTKTPGRSVTKHDTARYGSLVDLDQTKQTLVLAPDLSKPGVIPYEAIIEQRKALDEAEREPYDYEANLAAFKKMGVDVVDWLTTGIPDLDDFTMIPRGRLTHIYGPWGVGKTTLCLNMVAGMKGLRVLYIDSEAALNPELLLSLKVDPKFFTIYNKSAFIEDIYEVILQAVEKPKYDLIILDSMAGCTHRTEAAGAPGDANMGQMGKIVSKLLRILPGELKRTNTAFIIINQVRQSFKNFGKPTYTLGGDMIHFTASLELALKTMVSQRFPTTGPPFKGHEVTVKIEKSKVNEPYRVGNFKLYYPTRKPL